MKKILLALIICFSFNVNAQTHHKSSIEAKPATIAERAITPVANVYWSGPTSICCKKANFCGSVNATKFKYTLIVPTGSTNLIVNGWNIGNGVIICNSSSSGNVFLEVIFDVMDCSTKIASFKTLTGSYNDSNGKLCAFNDISINITLNILDDKITENPAWKVSVPYYDQTPIVYSINPVCGATSYQWNVPLGWTIVSNSGTSITVIPSLTGGGTVSVQAKNSCVSTVNSKPITRPIEQPTIIPTTKSQCLINNPGKVFTINAVPNASSYLWTCPSGWSWSGSVPTQLSASVNFNNVAQKANVCVQSVFPNGVLSAPTCYTYTTYITGPAMVDLDIVGDENASRFTFFTTDNSIIQTSTSVPTSSTIWTDQGNFFEWTVIAPRHYTFWIRTKNDCGVSTYEKYYLDVQPSANRITKSSLPTESNAHELFLFPNPNNGQMQLSYTLEKTQEGELQIIDMLGKKVSSYKLTGEANTLSINETELKEGIYLYRVVINGELVKTDRISIVH